jgi:Raf kinase inhibitor-like YbhB/YbcL family protein
MIALVVCGCTNEGKLASHADAADGLSGLRVNSPAFANGKAIPKKYTVDGANVSPPLAWGEGPTQTKGFVLIVEDPDVRGKEPFVHWIVYAIPATQTSLSEGASSVTVQQASLGTAKEGKNSKGLMSYVGPEPAPGKPHHYVFQVFAVDAPLDLAAGATKKQVLEEMKGHVLTQGEVVGTYQR